MDGIEGFTMKIAIFVGSLSIGGAERQFALLARGLADRGHDVRVLTMVHSPPPNFDDLLDGIPIHVLFPRAWVGPLRLVQLLRGWRQLLYHLRQDPVDVVYSALEWPNYMCIRACRDLPGTAAVVGMRHAADETMGWKRRLPIRLSAGAGRPEGLVANSRAGMQEANHKGLIALQEHVIANGIDTEHFAPTEIGALKFRESLGIQAETPLIGQVGRVIPLKDHRTLLNAFALLSTELPHIHLVCCGQGAEVQFQSLQALASSLSIADRVHWVKHAKDLPAVYSALDHLMMSSRSEGFPNVVAEAMACGTQAVVTDVGEAGHIVGDTGAVVSVGDANQMASAALRLLRQQGHNSARSRITELFSVPQLVSATEAVLTSSFKSLRG